MKHVREQGREIDCWNCFKESKVPTGEQAEFTTGLLERCKGEGRSPLTSGGPKACRVEKYTAWEGTWRHVHRQPPTAPLHPRLPH